MVNVLYFAAFREKLNCEQEDIQLSSDNMTVRALMTQLGDRGGVWQDVFKTDRRILVAVNQEMVKLETIIKDQDEIGFFPPVTGG